MGNLVHLCKETKESIDKEEKSIKKLTPYVEVKKAIKKDPIDALEDAAIKKAKELKAEHDAKKKLEEDAKKKLEEAVEGESYHCTCPVKEIDATGES